MARDYIVKSCMEFEVNCLDELSDDNLKELSATLVTKIKEAKKKVSVHLKKDGRLMVAWVTKLGVDPPKALPEEVLEVRNRRKKEFELALASNSDAFVAFQVNAFLIQLNEAVRAVRTSRRPTKSK